MKNTMKVALCGVTAALTAVVMFFTGIVPVATVALPAAAGCLLIPVVAELGVSWGFGVYAAGCVVSFLLAPDREAALIYLLFFGYYPVLFGVLGNLRRPVVRFFVKFLIFNLAAVAEGLLTVFVLHIPWENISFLGWATPAVLLLLANVVFVLYDKALGGLIGLYFQRFHVTVQKFLKGN